MEREIEKELCTYIQTILNLSISLYEVLNNNSDLPVKLHNEIQKHYEDLKEALAGAIPNDDDLEEVVGMYMHEDFKGITDNSNYRHKVFSAIKWAETNGCVLEFIAAAHKKNPGNPLLDKFVKQDLKRLIETCVSSVPGMESIQPTQHSSLPPTKDLSLKSKKDHIEPKPRNRKSGQNGYSTVSATMPATLAPLLEPAQRADSAPPPLLFPNKVALEDTQPSQDLIVQAYRCIRDARCAIQSVQEAFQDDEDELIAQINKAQKYVKDIPIPNYPGLYYRLPGKQKLFDRISGEIVFSLRAKQSNNVSPRFLQQGFEKFEKLLTILQKLEDFIRSYEQHIEQSGKTSNMSFGNGK